MDTWRSGTRPSHESNSVALEAAQHALQCAYDEIADHETKMAEAKTQWERQMDEMKSSLLKQLEEGLEQGQAQRQEEERRFLREKEIWFKQERAAQERKDEAHRELEHHLTVQLEAARTQVAELSAAVEAVNKRSAAERATYESRATERLEDVMERHRVALSAQHLAHLQENNLLKQKLGVMTNEALDASTRSDNIDARHNDDVLTQVTTQWRTIDSLRKELTTANESLKKSRGKTALWKERAESAEAKLQQLTIRMESEIADKVTEKFAEQQADFDRKFKLLNRHRALENQDRLDAVGEAARSQRLALRVGYQTSFATTIAEVAGEHARQEIDAQLRLQRQFDQQLGVEVKAREALQTELQLLGLKDRALALNAFRVLEEEKQREMEVEVERVRCIGEERFQEFQKQAEAVFAKAQEHFTTSNSVLRQRVAELEMGASLAVPQHKEILRLEDVLRATEKRLQQTEDALAEVRGKAKNPFWASSGNLLSSGTLHQPAAQHEAQAVPQGARDSPNRGHSSPKKSPHTKLRPRTASVDRGLPRLGGRAVN